jgi:hypothetical protein
MTKIAHESTLTCDDLSFYQQMIVEDTGCALEDAYKVEQIMRDFVLHSTLDWLSRAQYRREARKSYKILQDEHLAFEEYFDTRRKHTEQFFAENETQNQQEQTTA